MEHVSNAISIIALLLFIGFFAGEPDIQDTIVQNSACYTEGYNDGLFDADRAHLEVK